MMVSGTRWRWWPERICGRDIDDVFAYPSVKMVRIRDARLGIFKLVLMVAIVAYVAVYELAYQGLYLESSTVSGATRLSLQQPTENDCDPTDRGCKNAFGLASEAPYCAQSNQTYAGTKQYCEYYENVGAGIVENSALLASTRITTYEQEQVCNASSGSACPFLFNTSAESTNYVMDAEKFTVLIDHSAVTDSTSTKSSSELTGRLYVEKAHGLCRRERGFESVYGQKRTHKAPCYVAPNVTSRNLDYFSLQVLLEATGVSLDQLNYGGQTYRETGAVLLLGVTYTNFREWRGKSQTRYYYTPDLVAHSSSKSYDPIYDPYRSKRTLLNQHGIHVQVALTGTLRRFLFNNLLVQLTTSLTLFAVATVVTDFCALYLLPDHKIYDQYKYDTTPDFSDLRDHRRRLQSSGGGGASSNHNPISFHGPDRTSLLSAADDEAKITRMSDSDDIHI